MIDPARLDGPVEPDELAALEARVQAALRGAQDDGAGSGLSVLGYGEISCVLALSARAGRFACKRLPRFARKDALEAYARLLDEYLRALAARGVEPIDSSLQAVPDADGGFVAYCVQPIVEASCLGPRALAAAGEAEARRQLEAIVDATQRCASARVGLDAQLSNWAWLDGKLRYFDVTTPLLRDASGRERLDLAIFLASLPAPLRLPVRAFVVQGILDRYYAPRPALRDLAANLYKERLERHLPQALTAINRVVSPPLDAAEVKKDYDADAKTWLLLQRLRRADRYWQRRVRRRVYPFLLPGKIAR